MQLGCFPEGFVKNESVIHWLDDNDERLWCIAKASNNMGKSVNGWTRRYE